MARSQAKIITDAGTITIAFLEKEAPKTAESFMKLASGEQRYIDINGKKSNRPFYDGLKVHRVHPDLGIFSGCPFGNGRGWPGYYTFDEESERSNFDRDGLVAMAKIPGDTRVGSQFFITLKPEPRFSGKYTAFAQVVEGMDIVRRIANVPRTITMEPVSPIYVKKIEILRN